MAERLRVEIMLLVLLLSLAVPLNLKLGGVLTVYTFDIALALMYGVWLAHLVGGTGPRPRLGAIDVAALLMLAWFAVSALLGVKPLVSLDEAFAYLRMYLIYVYVANNLCTQRHVRYFVNLLLGLIAVEGVVSIIQNLTRSSFGSIPDMVGSTVNRIRVLATQGSSVHRIGKNADPSTLLYRSRGTLGYDTTLGYWFNLLLPIPVSLWFWSKRWRQRVGHAALMAVGFVGLVLTFTRGAWVGFAFAVAVVLFLLWRNVGLSREHWLALGGGAVLLAGLLWVLREPIQSRLWPTIGDYSLGFRRGYNRVAIQLISERPIGGIGLGNFHDETERILSRKWPLGQGGARKAHNVYLAVASETGLPGVGLFLVFLLVAAITFYRALEGSWAFGAAVGRALFAGFCGVLVCELVGWGLLNYQVFPLFWALLGLATAMRRLPTEVDATKSLSENSGLGSLRSILSGARDTPSGPTACPLRFAAWMLCEELSLLAFRIGTK